MVFPLVLLTAAAAGGTAATYLYQRRGSFPWRLAAGTVTGLAAFALTGLIVASVFGLDQSTGAVAAGIVLLPVLFVRHASDAVPAVQKTSMGALILFSLSGILLWFVAGASVYTSHDGLYTGVSHNIGDLPFHLATISRFANGQNLPPEHPSFAGVSFTYPFLPDFGGAMFVLAGASAVAVTKWSTLLLALGFVVLLHQWTLAMTDSPRAAILAPGLALFSGGFGWMRFATELWSSNQSPVGFLGHLTHDYTITSDGAYRWGNLVTSLLVTQRGLLLGLPLALVVFHLWWDVTSREAAPSDVRRQLTAAGIITGLLPLIHAHGFAVLVGIGCCVALLSSNRRRWLPFVGFALALGLPQLAWMMLGSEVDTGRFVGWRFGWDRGAENALMFWLRNTGLFIPLLGLALVWRRPTLVPPGLLRFYLPFTLCFIVPNMLQMAPWIWDNIKVLVFWFIASIPLVALLLVRIAEGGVARRVLAGAAVMALIAAGALDVWRVVSGGFENRVFDRAGMTFASEVMRRTPASARLLHAPVHNHPVVLSGRQSLMGYAGHVWSHGLNGGQRTADIKHIYAGEQTADQLLAAHAIDFIVLGPDERRQLVVNEAYVARHALVLEHDGYRLYRTSHAGQ